ncbi:MAG TPA: LUD domain-containing protein [Chitinophagaceae bacterium]|jgi:L-lactate dehydrogenase complex protein LldG|nr:LUD domain-containing protein [Chitinophagaceae bacterium]
MNSRERILSAVRKSQPEFLPLPERYAPPPGESSADRFAASLQGIGGQARVLAPGEDLPAVLRELFPEARRVVSADPVVAAHYLHDPEATVHRSLEDVEVALIRPAFGVAENGAVWVTEAELKIRVLPFICEHLVALLSVRDIVPHMQAAYARIGSADYGFGAFIAGPSKTADIEQSLVLGAHGPKTMTVLLLPG